MEAEGYAKAGTPVDTRRLRNSIMYQQIDDHTEHEAIYNLLRERSEKLKGVI